MIPHQIIKSIPPHQFMYSYQVEFLALSKEFVFELLTWSAIGGIHAEADVHPRSRDLLNSSSENIEK